METSKPDPALPFKVIPKFRRVDPQVSGLYVFFSA